MAALGDVAELPLAAFGRQDAESWLDRQTPPLPRPRGRRRRRRLTPAIARASERGRR